MEQNANNEGRNGGNADAIPDHISISAIIENYCKKEDVKNRYGNRINSMIRKIDDCLKKIDCSHVSSLKTQLQNDINLLSDKNRDLFGETKSKLVEEVLKFYGFIEE